jgi:nitrogen regulatory protein PII
MKLIIAVIQPTRFRAVQAALIRQGVERVTVCDSQEFRSMEGRPPIFRGVRFESDVLRKITLEIAVNDDFLERTIATLETVGRTAIHGADGDGKIFVLPLCEAIHFHPEKRGPGAI